MGEPSSMTRTDLEDLIRLAREAREAHTAHCNARLNGPVPDFEEISKNDKASWKRFEAKAEHLLREFEES